MIVHGPLPEEPWKNRPQAGEAGGTARWSPLVRLSVRSSRPARESAAGLAGLGPAAQAEAPALQEREPLRTTVGQTLPSVNPALAAR